MQENDKLENTPDRPATTALPSDSTKKTRISTAWLLIVSFVLGLVLLLIFILQNLQDVTLNFFNLHWKVPLGLAMLLALVAGGLMVAVFGTARVVQLGRKLRQDKN